MARGHRAPSNRKSRIPVAVIGGCSWCALLSQQVSNSVVNLRRLAKHFQNRVLADGTDGTCEPQIVALPSGRECAYTVEPTEKCSITRVRVPTSLYR